MGKIKMIATGDSFVTRRLPEGGYEGFEEIKAVIEDHQVKFSNLEMTFHRMEGTPAAVSGGTWAMAGPECLDDMKSYGFNLFTTANNHSGDYGEGGVTATIRHLKERCMAFSGTGRNLDEASGACYLETSGARIGLVSACSTFELSGMAGSQSGLVCGRPGLNPLRFQTTYHVKQEYFDMVNRLAELTYVNAYDDYGVKIGYGNPCPEGVTHFGKHLFMLDEENAVHSAPLEKDMKRLEEEIREARRQSDLVLASIHAHETAKDDFSVPPEYLELAARRCIDAGAKVVIGHGPHELRGIEVYHGGVIFYSLGNFIFQTETVSVQPYEAFYNKGLPAETKVGFYMDLRSKGDTAGYPTQENIWRSVMAGWTVEDGKITQVQLYPVSLGMGMPRTKRGTPVLSKDDGTLSYLAKLSEPYGTQIQIKDHVGYINL